MIQLETEMAAEVRHLIRLAGKWKCPADHQARAMLIVAVGILQQCYGHEAAKQVVFHVIAPLLEDRPPETRQ